MKQKPAKNLHQSSSMVVLSRRLKLLMPKIRETYKVRSLGIFGSFVRAEQRKGSDLDLLVEFDEAPTLFEFVHLKRHLSQELGLPVDLVMQRALKPKIGEHILQEVKFL